MTFCSIIIVMMPIRDLVLKSTFYSSVDGTYIIQESKNGKYSEITLLIFIVGNACMLVNIECM